MRDQGMDGFSRDGCTIGENWLSMDGRYLDGMGFPARDRWSIVFIKLKTNWSGCVFDGWDIFRGGRFQCARQSRALLIGWKTLWRKA